jgi:hypothetical protein
MTRALALMLFATAAHADLYRWIDPESGSVKFSNVAPASQAGVQVVPYRGPAPSPAATSASGAAAGLEQRWRRLLEEVSAMPAGSPALQQRLQEFIATTAELEKADPAGAPRRRGEAEAVLQRLLRVER